MWGIGDDKLRDLRHWISDVWNEIAGDGDPNHLLAGTSAERMRNPGAAIRYVSGYASKADQTRPGEKVGRYWGVVGRNHIPWGTAETVSLDEEQSKIVLRTMRRYMRAVNRQSRIRRVAKMVALEPKELIGWGGWFDRHRMHYGKHLRAAGAKMPQKLRLRNLRSMNVFLNVEQWREKLGALVPEF